MRFTHSRPSMLASLLFGILALIAMPHSARAQAVFYPNTFSGTLRFANSNPDVVNLLGTTNQARETWVNADSIGVTPAISSVIYSNTKDGNGIRYVLPVDTASSGTKYKLRTSYRTGPIANQNTYYFLPYEAPTLYPAPQPGQTVSFQECPGLLEVRWVDALDNPVPVSFATMSATVESEPGKGFNFVRASASNIPAGATSHYLAIGGNNERHSLYVLYEIGQDAAVDKIRYECRTEVTGVCDTISTVRCVVPTLGQLGEMAGRFDIVGEEENRTPASTQLAATGAPYSNYREFRFPGTPSSGEFVLPNLLPASWFLSGQVSVRKNRAYNWIQLPYLTSGNRVVTAGQRTDIGNALVMQPGYAKGTFRLLMPSGSTTGVCTDPIIRDSDTDANKDGVPDNGWMSSSYVGASGLNKVAPGALQSVWPATAKSEYESKYDSALNELSGSYELVMPAIRSEPAFWKINTFSMRTKNAASPTGYRDAYIAIENRAAPETLVRAGETTTVNHEFCMSEVQVSFKSTSGVFYQPQLRANASFSGIDAFGRQADYSMNNNFWQGSPVYQYQAANTGQVTMCVPQGYYELKPTVAVPTLSGSSGITALRTINLSVGCRQVVRVTQDLQLNVETLPKETDKRRLTLSGSASSQSNITKVTVKVNGGSERVLCTSCGTNALFSGDIDLSVGVNEILVYALDAAGNEATVKADVKSIVVDNDGDGTPDSVDGCPADPMKVAAGACGCGVADTDSDGDGKANCQDLCPSDARKTAAGICGCGIADSDFDGDGKANCQDMCPNDANKTASGACGCGIPDTDSDGDGKANCQDACPNDSAKITAGSCGCGVAETDSDGDGKPNCQDLCPSDARKTAAGICGCGVADTDSDGDGSANCQDLCPSDGNKTAAGACGCGVADTDVDGDGHVDCRDLCPNDPAKTAAGACGCGVSDIDADNDGTPDCNDSCPADAAKLSAGACGCGVADTDSDGDGSADCEDLCPADGTKTSAGACGCGNVDTDADRDGTMDCVDSCPVDEAKTAPGACGCGVADTDSDNDGTPDCRDQCSADPGKIEPGVCGCGEVEDSKQCLKKKKERVAICHLPPGNPENRQSITVSKNAVSAHLAHGDTLGACPKAKKDKKTRAEKAKS